MKSGSGPTVCTERDEIPNLSHEFLCPTNAATAFLEFHCYHSAVSYPQPQRSYDSSSTPPGGPPLGRIRFWSITQWLIAINVAVFVVDMLSRYQLTLWGYFSVDAAIRHVQIWRFLTFQFLHADIGHIFFNMLSLYFFGPLVESWLGRKRY